MNKIVILDTFISGHTFLWGLSLLGLVLFAIIFAIYIMMESDEWKAKSWIGVLIFSGLIALCIVGTVLNTERGYYIYPNNVSIEEIETEYEITNIDGLILTGFKK